MRPFEEARNFAQRLELCSQGEWQDFTKGKYVDKPNLPKDIPISPILFTEQRLKGYSDWLDFTNKYQNWRDYNSAHDFTKKLKLKNETEWIDYKNGLRLG